MLGLAPKLAELWKEPVAVENRPGASGLIGADFVAQAPAKLPAASIRELIALARANPGKLSYASSGTGAASHLSAVLNRVLGDADARSRMLALGADPEGNTREEFARFIREDQAKWAKLMREAGITPE